MINKFENYYTTLEALTDAELDRSAEKLVVSENTNIAKLIAHLAEMAERKTALRMGYRSLYDYCIRRLNLSEGAVPARVHVANVCRRFPQLLAALAESRISLTVASLLAAHVTDDNVDQLIADCAGKTRKETEVVLVALAPKPVFRPSIRKAPSRPDERTVDPSRQTTKATKATKATEATESGEELSPPTPPPSRSKSPRVQISPTILQPAEEAVFNFRFSADKEFKDKFERLAEVLGVVNAEKNMASVMEKALELALEKKDPKKRLERRVQREKRKEAPGGQDRREEARRSRPNDVAKKEGARPSRHVPADTRDRVHAKGDYQCEYRGLDETRCTSRIVQVDHVKPFARSPHHDERWLRLLCREHNGLEAERVYGKAFMQRKVEARKRRRTSTPPARTEGPLLLSRSIGE